MLAVVASEHTCIYNISRQKALGNGWGTGELSTSVKSYSREYSYTMTIMQNLVVKQKKCRSNCVFPDANPNTIARLSPALINLAN